MMRHRAWGLAALAVLAMPLSAQVRQAPLRSGEYLLYVDNQSNGCTISVDGARRDASPGDWGLLGLPASTGVRRIRANGRVLAEISGRQHTSLVVSESCGLSLLQAEDPAQLRAESLRRIAAIEGRVESERRKRTLYGLGGLLLTGVGAALISEAEDGASPAGGIALTFGLYGLVSWLSGSSEPTAREEKILERARQIVTFIDGHGLP